jgi:fructoselysine-6-P-deglycase FrlB-like protein
MRGQLSYGGGPGQRNLNFEDVLVIFSSKSGANQDTVNATQFVKKLACRKLLVTRDETTPLVTFNYPAYYFGDMPQAFQATAILLYAYVGGLWASMAEWNDDALITLLKELPAALISGFNLAQGFFDPIDYLVNK